MSVRLSLMRLAGRMGVLCGAFGGAIPIERRTNPFDGRWCLKPLGHDDSCAYDDGPQPHWEWRRRARGWRE